MTATLRTSQETPRGVRADAIIVGVVQGPGGPRPAPGAEDVDAALGGKLAETLAALGATGKAEEVTRIASAGQLAAPLIAAVGLGTPPEGPAFDEEALRTGSGAAVRALVAGKARQIALALPARDAAEAEAVALGALLGGYVFGRYRDRGKQADTELILLTSGDNDAAARRARILADAVTLVRDLVNTGPSDLFPASFAAEAERIAGAAGLAIEVLDETGVSGLSMRAETSRPIPWTTRAPIRRYSRPATCGAANRSWYGLFARAARRRMPSISS